MADLTTWADVRCPWCWMGHRRLGVALGASGWEGRVERRSFLLEPDGPAVASVPIEHAALTEWGMVRRDWDAMRDRIADAAARDGLTIDMGRVRAIDSRPVHRLLKLAVVVGVDPYLAWDQAFEALLAGHRDLGDEAVLRELGAELGITPAQLDVLSTSDRFVDEVAADHRAAVARGVHGVPTLVEGDRVLTGSREVDELVAFLAPAAVTR